MCVTGERGAPAAVDVPAASDRGAREDYQATAATNGNQYVAIKFNDIGR